ncbi:MAG: hypothetical protein Dbin4_03134 [Alphaproteobacteria bacterium]|nr:hypothetical protein [Alphaproteobacteria bacterium]
MKIEETWGSDAPEQHRHFNLPGVIGRTVVYESPIRTRVELRGRSTVSELRRLLDEIESDKTIHSERQYLLDWRIY